MLSLYKSSKKRLVFRFGVDVCMLQGKVNNHTAAKKVLSWRSGQGKKVTGADILGIARFCLPKQQF